MVIEVVLRVVAGHVGPIDAAHVFTPAENLPDEAFRRCQRHAAGFIRCSRLGDDLAWIKHFGIQREGEQRVEKPPGPMGQRVLKIAKMRQGFVDEIIELLQSFGTV